jgi:hypothetical protein
MVEKLASTENIFSASILRVRKAALSNFKSARSFLSTLFLHAVEALLRPSSLKLGGVGINVSEDRQIISDLSQYVLYYITGLTLMTWWDAGGIFACPDTDSFSARCQNREGQSPLAIHTAAFVHVLVLLAAGFALCFGESINLT